MTDARTGLVELHEKELAELETLKAFARKDDPGIEGVMAEMEKNLTDIRASADSCFVTETYKQCADSHARLRAACAKTTVPDYVTDGGTGSNKPVNPGE